MLLPSGVRDDLVNELVSERACVLGNWPRLIGGARGEQRGVIEEEEEGSNALKSLINGTKISLSFFAYR